MSNIALPYTQIIDPASFKSILNAKIYIGEYGVLPNPANSATWKQAYFVQDDGTRVAASQPIRTNAAGFTVDGSGNVRTVQVDGQYSLIVQDSLSVQKYSNTRVTDLATDLANTIDPVKGAAMVGFLQSGTGAVGRTIQSKLRDQVSVKDFGASGDGVTDDSAAINAATLYASTLASVYNTRVTVIIPHGVYRIMNSLIPRSYIRIVGYGAELLGPITGYGRIDGSTAVPAASDLAGQTNGACWTEAVALTDPTATAASISSPAFEGFTLNNFRFGFLSRGFAWYYPSLKNIKWMNCDICNFAYYGAQMWSIENPGAASCSSFFVGAATAFPSGHPMSSSSNTSSFCDGLRIYGYDQEVLDIRTNANLDVWFSSSILRPSSTSVVSGYTGTFALSGAAPSSLATSFGNVSGRIVYIPQRHSRLTFATSIKNLHALSLSRGYVAIANPQNAEISHLRGEGLFLDSTINASNTECGVLLGLSNGSECSANIVGVDCKYVTGTAYDSVVGVAASQTPTTNIALHSISGTVNTAYYKWFTHIDAGDGAIAPFELSSNFATLFSATITPQNSSQYALVLNGYPYRDYDVDSGISLLHRVVCGDLPRAGNTETIVNLIKPAGVSYRGKFEPIQGKLKIFVRRKDTGVQDHGEFLITWGTQNASTTLSSGVSSGETTVPVTTGVYFGPGSVITIGGTDRYLVKGMASNVITLASPARASYSSGAAISEINTIDATIRALSGGIASLGFSGSSLQITNSLGSSVQIEFRAEFEYFGAPNQN